MFFRRTWLLVTVIANYTLIPYPCHALHTALAESKDTNHELASLIARKEQLQSYSRRSNCFQQVAGAIKLRCDELGVHEDQRIEAAISMTLCELATANQFPPLECASFSQSSEFTFSRSKSPRSCVEALSRSAQYWSSYSGYLREVPQLCYAFRRWNDIDTARDIYKNTTEQASHLFHHMRQSEEAGQKIREEVMSMTETMRSILNGLTAVNGGLEHTSLVLKSETAGIDHQVTAIIRHVLDDFIVNTMRKQEHSISQLELGAARIMQNHQASLTDFTVALRSAVDVQMLDVLTRFEAEYGRLSDLTESVFVKWNTIGNGLDRLHTSTFELTSNVHNAAILLNSYIESAVFAQEVQQNATRATADLALTLTRMSDYTHLEMMKMNNTAVRMREDILAYQHPGLNPFWTSGEAWVKDVSLWLLKNALGVSRLAFLDGLVTLPTFGILYNIIQVVWFVVRLSFSSIASTLAVILSYRRWNRKSDAARYSENLIVYSSAKTSKPSLRYPLTAQDHSGLRCRSGIRSRTSRIPERLLR